MSDQIILESYGKKHADGVARMWKESREGWPPGFLGASEFTAESVEMEERASGSLFTILALEGDRVVGFCRTTPYGGEPDAAYVALLNVVPDMHGRKLGKMLLLDAVERSAEQNFYRMDLHTWPANLKAMPLYKKTGFFWVPDTMVYMQNYMPFLIGRPEFKDFLGGRSWYDLFVRELKVEPDEERTPSGRETFTYVFQSDGKEFRAGFDRRGRILSSLEVPGFSVSIEREEGRIFFGRPVDIQLRGSSLPGIVNPVGNDDLDLPAECSVDAWSSRFQAVHRPVPVPTPDRDRSPRVTVTVPWEKELLVGLGLRAEEEIRMISSQVRRIEAGTRLLDINVKRLSETRRARVLLSLEGKTLPPVDVELVESVFQRLEIPIPELPNGVNLLSLAFEIDGASGAEEKLLLIRGVCGDPCGWSITRSAAVSVGRDSVLLVGRMGASARLLGFDTEGKSIPLGGFRLMAGPPFWNSDLPHQLYEFEIEGEFLVATSTWPSRPGMIHRCTFRLDPAGFAEGSEAVTNDSGVDQKVRFSTAWHGSHHFQPMSDIIPLREGLFRAERIYNQVPDWAEDLPRRTAELGAPWLGLSGPDRSLMVHFEGWDRMQYDAPETEDLLIEPGGTVSSPPLRLLLAGGGTDSLIGKGLSAGWELGETDRRIDFIVHDLQPVMPVGAELTLSHSLGGKRDGRISVDGAPVAEGTVNSGTVIHGTLEEAGFREVGLAVAGREFIHPVLSLGETVAGVQTREENGLLLMENSRMKAVLDPGAFGHVFSLELDGVEFLMSSHPEPSEFAWEKPWFGGIHPRICDHQEKPFRLDNITPTVQRFVPMEGALPEVGWVLSWDIDHKRFGSLRLLWRVTMLPGIPVLRTSFVHEALCGAYPDSESDIRAFLSPGGGHGEAVLTEESRPELRQGRKTAGAWSVAGKWARVENPSGGFVEAYPNDQGHFFAEDYADCGCHLSLYSITDRRRELVVTWLLGTAEEDERLSGVYRAHIR